MTKNKTPGKQSAAPVIYVHARNQSPVNADQVSALLGLGLPVLCRLEVEGAIQTANGYDQPSLLLAELAKSYPGRPVIILRAGLLPAKAQLDRLQELSLHADGPLALSVLSNAETAVNPFAGLTAVPDSIEYDLAGLVNLLAPGYLHTFAEWVDHFVFMPPETITLLVNKAGDGTLMQQLAAIGGRLQIPDNLFVRDTGKRVFEKRKVKSYETLYPPPFGELSTRLQAWTSAGIKRPPFTPYAKKPATLHITHSWGGGVAQWISSFIDADTEHTQFQLRSESAQSNQAYGQKLSLYAGNELRCPITSWWLQPPIESVTVSHSAYSEIVSEICMRFGIGRIFVSSLIGHSLEVLGTGLPTVQILHDHFPVWPILAVNPEPYISGTKGADLKTALAEHKKSLIFTDKDGFAWAQVNKSYLHALTENKVKVVAPGQWVLDLQNRLESGFTELDTHIVPHGLPMLDEPEKIAPRPRDDNRLRMVILGRMQEGKGQKLLAQALPGLAKYVQVYLLGTGKLGEAFFGMSGVDVVLEYEREELGELLAKIGPDFAALLSVIPETFSYTLSELQQFGIPAVATSLGSFIGRIEHGKTGWLVDANADAVIKQVAGLCEDPGQIESVRENLKTEAGFTTRDMVEAYNRICPPPKSVKPFLPSPPELLKVQWAAADFHQSMLENKLSSAQTRLDELEKDLQLRTEWAQKENKARLVWEKLSQDLEQERNRRDVWVEQLEVEVHMCERKLADTRNNLQQTSRELSQLLPVYQVTLNRQKLMLESTSWKITRPFRALRRATNNFMTARAWNPLRWPWLLSSLVRNLSTLGPAGTLRRIQADRTEAMAAPSVEAVPSSGNGERGDSVSDFGLPGPFPVFDQPDVSIVIPVHNNWTYTATCLSSLLAVKSGYSFEVIVVDDQSRDVTEEQLAQIEGLTYLRNDQNLGFVSSCNRGAKHANGKFLVLLNNDTEVTDGWLDELIDTFDQDPEIGLVGSRLVYPDGRLQESGGIIFNDASGWNYGRDGDANHPEYHFLREVDYCSGACIALKTAFFHELGDLDERYSPAYYEDTDLAFRVREAGYKVMVQPCSVVIHHEGVTSGTDTSSGTKQYQLINQEKFLDRWQTELKSQPAPVHDKGNRKALREAINHRSKGRILFIDATTPEPDKDSGSVRLTNMLRIFRDLGYGVTFFADNRVYAGEYTRNLQRTGVEVLYYPWLESLSDFFRRRGSEFDYIFISRHYIATNYILLLKRYCPDSRFIFDTVDLHYLRERRLAELENSNTLKIAAYQTRRAELSVIKAADATLVVSPVEKKILAKDAPGEVVHVLSNIHRVPGRDSGFADRKDIYFVGGFQHPPNIDAARWFVEDVWPLIRAQLPDLQFHLIGSNAPDKIRSLEGDGVVFHGWVESLDSFLSGCRLAVAPLRYGAGVKGKVNMSMAHGQPMVLTPAASEGLFAEHEREVLIAANARSFAREVVRLYQDETLWYKLSDASIRNVEEHFSIEAARQSLVTLFDSLSTPEE